MGMWDYVWSSADSLKRNAPDLSAVKGLCGASYSHGLAAAAAMSDVGNQLHSLKQYMPDDEARRKIGRFTILLAKNAAFEYRKFIPGGEIVGNTWKDFHKWEDDHRAQGVTEKVLEADGSRRKLVSKEVEINKASEEEYFKSQTALNRPADQKPEDVIRTFMMKGFMGRQFLDDLMVPVPREAPYSKNK